MQRTQTFCPNCKQPVVIEIQQVFDTSHDPLAKQKLLSNAVNIIHCPTCKYQGMLAVPIVYHDSEKELLLTFFPPDLNTPVSEQEKKIGPLINRIMDQLPKEKRKAYLLQPKSMLTYQTLVEKILEADGITKEMIENQQKAFRLIEQLISLPKEKRGEFIKKEEEKFDLQFFTLFSRVIQSALAQGNENEKKDLLDLQNDLFEKTKVGKEIFTQAKETDRAIKALQDASKDGLTREKLLDLLIKSDNENQISTTASLARTGLDYAFFQLLSEKIEQEQNGAEKQRLITLRQKLLEITDEIDKRLQEEMQKSKSDLEKILESENIEKELQKNPTIINDFFIRTVDFEIKQARKDGNIERINKLEQVMVFLEKAAAASAEVEIIEKMLEYKDEDHLEKIIKENLEKINPEFLLVLNSLVTQTEEQDSQPDLKDRIRKVYKAVLRNSMKKRLEE